MQILKTKGWDQYALLDSGFGRRLEKFGKYTLSRPDPQAIWKSQLPVEQWVSDSVFIEGSGWSNNLESKWKISYKNLSFFVKQTAFKHTGFFPEQSLNWDYMENKISIAKTHYDKPINVLNLFGYTGIASLVCAQNDASVTHLDGSKPSIAWARENQALSNLNDKPIRWILDDALEFTAREARRGNIYDAIIMDPPVYGHGPQGQIWDFDKSFPALLENCRKILITKPVFVIINAYAISASSLMLANMLEDYLNADTKQIEFGELAIEESGRSRSISTGIFSRYSSF